MPAPTSSAIAPTHPPALAARQQAVWQPLIDWAARRYDAGARGHRRRRPARAIAGEPKAFAAAVAALDDFRLTALQAADRGLRLAGHRAGAVRRPARRRRRLRRLAARRDLPDRGLGRGCRSGRAAPRARRRHRRGGAVPRTADGLISVGPQDVKHRPAVLGEFAASRSTSRRLRAGPPRCAADICGSRSSR